MSQYLESYGLDRRRTAVFPYAWDIVEKKPLNSIWSLEFKLPGNDEKREHLKKRRLVRYQNGQLYRVLDTEPEEEDVSTTLYKCEHVLAKLSDKIVHGDMSIENVPTKDALRMILDEQEEKDWVLGECDFDYLYGYGWTSETLLNMLWSIPNCFPPGVHWKWVTDTSVYPYRLSLKRIDVEARPDCMVLKGLNVLGVKKPSKSSTLANRLYPVGRGEGVNQTNICKVNGGVPYIENKDSIAEYGLIEREYVDRSIEEPQKLLDVAKAYLAEACIPLEEYELDAAEVYSITGNRMYRPEPGDVLLSKSDGFKSYVTSVEQQHDKAGDLKLTVANKPSDLVDVLEDMADKARIESTYAQGNTILWGAPMCANADNSHPIKYPLWMPKSIIHANTIQLKIELSRFRTDSKGVRSGGGTAKTTSAAGGGTLTSANGGRMEEKLLSTSGSTTMPRGESGSISNTDGASPETSSAGEHRHKGGSHSHNLNAHKHSISSGNSETGSPSPSTTVTGGGVNTSYAGEHSHEVDNHTHGFNHWHTVQVGITLPLVPGHMHIVQVGNHTHSVDIPDHVHEQIYGIYMANEMPESASVKINGKDAFVMDTKWEGDITQWMRDSNGDIPRGRFVNIEVKPNANAFVTMSVAAQAFISGKEGGQY